MYRTNDIKTYKYLKSLGKEVELVPKTLLDVCLEVAETVAPRGNKYYLLNIKEDMERIAMIISDFDSSLEFELANSRKYSNTLILYLL